jgi:hypothetical protein
MEQGKNTHKMWVGNPQRERDHLEGLSMDGKILLKCITKK